MVNPVTFSYEHIKDISLKYHIDCELTQKAIYALCLVDALRGENLDFVFKGGSSLMLLFDTPRRLSTDVDIIVNNDVDIVPFLERIAQKEPFVGFEEKKRKTTKSIKKRHFKVFYNSKLNNKQYSVLLDVVYEKDNYSSTIDIPIKMAFLVEDGNTKVRVPDCNSLLADKLTAFAPHSTGIRFNNEDGTNDKRLEVIKQLYDISCLYDAITDFENIRNTYFKVLQKEIEYRNNEFDYEYCMSDTFYSALSILTKGKFMSNDYPNFIDGFQKIRPFIIGKNKVNSNNAYLISAKTMLLVSCLKTNTDIKTIIIKECPLLTNPEFNKINKIRPIDREAYNIAYYAIQLWTK